LESKVNFMRWMAKTTTVSLSCNSIKTTFPSVTLSACA
jgi:hypothetical protein